MATLSTISFGAVVSDIYLTWNANPPIEGVTKYLIYQAKSPSTNFIPVVTASNTNVAKVRVTSVGTYEYKVSAINGNGESPLSSSISVRIGSTNAPSQPVGLTNSSIITISQ